jgi:16S rRNA (cytosine1402-N4)-methyltransferase
LHRSHFAGLGKVIAREGIQGCDIIFADLGVSSMQVDDPARGFSYKHDGPLDMRMDDRLHRTAADFLAQLSSDELAHILTELADEPDAKRIAECIVRRRTLRPIIRTGQLVDLVFEVNGMTRRAWRERPPEQLGQLHPAARTFQALRMLVNDELSGLAQFLRVAPYCLNAGGRLGIISFHSGEDRRADGCFREGLSVETFSEISEMPIRPSPAEIAANPRSRSALFRWAIKSARGAHPCRS